MHLQQGQRKMVSTLVIWVKHCQEMNLEDFPDFDFDR